MQVATKVSERSVRPEICFSAARDRVESASRPFMLESRFQTQVEQGVSMVIMTRISSEEHKESSLDEKPSQRERVRVRLWQWRTYYWSKSNAKGT